MDGTEISQHAGNIVDRLGSTQLPPPVWVVVMTGVVALALVGYTPVWRVARNVVTIAHEGGHAVVALLTGRQLAGIRLHSDTSGVTVSRGKPRGLGMILTTLAGYPAPPLLGLGGAALLGMDRITVALWAAIGLCAALLIAIRNLYGALSVIGTGGLMFAVSWFGTDAQQAALAYLAVWFLLLAGLRPVLELQRTRRRQPGSDADQLGHLTHVPGVVWVLVFGVISAASLVLGASLLTAPLR